MADGRKTYYAVVHDPVDPGTLIVGVGEGEIGQSSNESVEFRATFPNGGGDLTGQEVTRHRAASVVGQPGNHPACTTLGVECYAEPIGSVATAISKINISLDDLYDYLHGLFSSAP